MKNDPIYLTRNDYHRLTSLLYEYLDKQLAEPAILHHLYLEIERAIKVDSHEVSPLVITMNSTVVYTIDDSQPEKITITYPEHTFPVRKFIEEKIKSIFDPLCVALLGYKAGSSFNWTNAGKTVKVFIKEIMFQPEASHLYYL